MKTLVAAAMAGLTVVGLVAGAPRAHADENEYLYALASEFYFVRILGPEKVLAEGRKVCDTIGDGPVTFDVITMVQVDLSVPLYTAQQIVNGAFNKLC
ncbi:hypothetical protein BH09ACT7_BH09ACT7_37900 [soil metagenome]